MKKPFWKTENPKKKSTPLTPEQKAQARARAKAAGRPYPNLIDNAAVAKKKTENATIAWAKSLGFGPPRFEYHNNQEFITSLKKCISYITVWI